MLFHISIPDHKKRNNSNCNTQISLYTILIAPKRQMMELKQYQSNDKGISFSRGKCTNVFQSDRNQKSMFFSDTRRAIRAMWYSLRLSWSAKRHLMNYTIYNPSHYDE